MKKRVFELDFIRAIAAVLIVITHFNARYMFIGTEEAYSKMVIGIDTFNLYIGALGVALFFIISGMALMMTYENGLSLKTFYQKRFWSIYPMFWIAYLAAFLHQFYCYRAINQGIPKQNIIFSVLGLDGYLLNCNVPVFYILGEWFLGFIIMFYILFPLLRWGVIKHPVVTAIITVGLYVLFNIWYPLEVPSEKSLFLFIRLPEIMFGMYFWRYIKKVNKRMILVSLAVILANTVLKPQYSSNVQTTYIGIAAFIILFGLGKYAEKVNFISDAAETVSKYSYPVFLVHHYIIAYIMGKFDLNAITVLESYILFILICFVVAFFARLLYEANKRIVYSVKRYTERVTA